MVPTGVPDHVAPDRVFPFDLYADARLLKGDLYDGYAQITRDKPDVFYTPQNGGHWVVTRYTSHRRFSRTIRTSPFARWRCRASRNRSSFCR
jgi:hypothetical protein